MNPGISPIAFYIGPLAVHWYGIIFAFIISLGAVLAAHEAKRRGEDPDQVWDGILSWSCLALWAHASIMLSTSGTRCTRITRSPSSISGMAAWRSTVRSPVGRSASPSFLTVST